MVYMPITQELGIQAIGAFSSTQAHALGHVVRAIDSTYGEGEFIYLKGVASTAVGSLVTYDALLGTTALSPNTANLGQPVAVSMSANILATTYGWYQISGAAVIKKTAVTVSPSVRLYQSATTGQVMSTSAAGKEIVNARSVNAATVASATSTITAVISRPFMQGVTT